MYNLFKCYNNILVLFIGPRKFFRCSRGSCAFMISIPTKDVIRSYGNKLSCLDIMWKRVSHHFIVINHREYTANCKKCLKSIVRLRVSQIPDDKNCVSSKISYAH